MSSNNNIANDNANNKPPTSAIAASAAAAAAAAREQQQQQQQQQQQPAHGYSDIQPASSSVDQTHIHPSLRAAAPATTLVPTANMMSAPAATAAGEASAAATAPPPGNSVLSAANLAQVAPAPPAPGTEQAQQGHSDGRRAKRELSQSKRAAQNRAAQRAFRQRKEGYIKKLEEQVKQYEVMENSYKALTQENFQLRNYIIALQGHHMGAHGEFPPPPPSLNLQNQPAQAPPPPPANNVAEPTRDANTGTDLSAIAQAVEQLPPVENLEYPKQEKQQQQAQEQQAAQQQNEDVTMEDEHNSYGQEHHSGLMAAQHYDQFNEPLHALIHHGSNHDAGNLDQVPIKDERDNSYQEERV
ncbi:transcription factor kapC [Zalerion maritima]|uniref:Putative transcription factor kapC n=1 Tax=Zalerion maritima TaxID=339359 RepID=A0AAD5RJH3_9PEZI|nr:transcription factor kapC [Zalerion maritima]